MLVAIDKRGGINLPLDIRKRLGLEKGHYLELRVEDGGVIVLQPVAVYPAIRLSERGIEKLREARESGTAPMPEWMSEEISDIS